MGPFASRTAGALALLLLAGCLSRTPVPVFYTLTAVESPIAATAETDGPALAVGPASLPRYLDRPQIATRQGSRVSYAPYNRWAATLESELLRVMGANLGRLLRTERVVVYPAEPRFPVAYRVTVEVEQFDGDPGGGVVLRARWAIARPRASKAAAIGSSEIRQPVASADDDERSANGRGKASGNERREREREREQN